MKNQLESLTIVVKIPHEDAHARDYVKTELPSQPQPENTDHAPLEMDCIAILSSN